MITEVDFVDVHSPDDRIDISPEFSFDHILQYVFVCTHLYRGVINAWNSFSKLAVAFAVEMSSY